MRAETSAPTPNERTASCTTTALPVLRDRSQNRLHVERAHRAQVDDFAVDALGPAVFSRDCHDVVHRAAVADQRDVPARLGDPRLAEGNGPAALGRRRRAPIAREMLDEQHRILVLDRTAQQSIGVRRVRRHDHLDARRMAEPRFQKIRVLAAGLKSRTRHGADHHGHMRLPARHEAQLRRVIGDLVHAHRQKIHQHDLDDRSHAGDRSADSRRR